MYMMMVVFMARLLMMVIVRHLMRVSAEMLEILVSVVLKFIVKLNYQVFDTYISKDHLRVAYHIFGISASGHLQFEATNINVGGKRPKVGFLDTLNAFNLSDLKIKIHRCIRLGSPDNSSFNAGHNLNLQTFNEYYLKSSKSITESI